MSDRVNIVGLYQRVAKGELTPEEAAILAEFGDLRFEKTKFIVSMFGVVLTLAAVVFVSIQGQDDVEAWKAKYFEELRRPRAGCVVVDATHELCERKK